MSASLDTDGASRERRRQSNADDIVGSSHPPDLLAGPDQRGFHAVSIQTAQRDVDTMAVEKHSVTSSAPIRLLAGWRTSSGPTATAVVSHYNVSRDRHLCDAEGRDSRSRSDIKRWSTTQPRISQGRQRCAARPGQHDDERLSQLYVGIGGGDRADLPLIVITSNPGRSLRHHHALRRRWRQSSDAVFATGTTLSVPALTGAIMCMGVATANSILVISFAREQMEAGLDATIRCIRGGSRAVSPGADDGAGNGHRQAAWRSSRDRTTHWTRRDRRADFCHLRHAVLVPAIFSLVQRPAT